MALKPLIWVLVTVFTLQSFVLSAAAKKTYVVRVKYTTQHPNVTCGREFRDPGQLNYPSFVVVFNKSRVVRYARELTNVGREGSVYQALIVSPLGVRVDVEPDTLVFKKVGDKRRYTVTLVSEKGADSSDRTEFGRSFEGTEQMLLMD